MEKAISSLITFKTTFISKDKKIRDGLINIEQETGLLIEIEDIRDELNIISMILKEQELIAKSLSEVLPTDPKEEDGLKTSETYEGWRRELLEVIRKQTKHIAKMEEQAKRTYDTVSPFAHTYQCGQLNFSAHSYRGPQVKTSQRLRGTLRTRTSRRNGKARSNNSSLHYCYNHLCRYSAQNKSLHNRHSNVIQLPLSFMAAFFAINVVEFPRDSNGAAAFPLDYVSKYICKKRDTSLNSRTHIAHSRNIGRCVSTFHRYSL
jgi:hypothetical protein